MKIIHTADLHLESKMESNLSKEQAAQRREELINTFENIIDYARDNGVEIILISGDMFDKSSIRKTAMIRVLDLINSNPGISFMYLKGNHDCEAFENELSIDRPQNMFFFSANKWLSYDFDENIVITGREINDSNSNTMYSDLVLDVSKFNIVMLHGQESEYMGTDKTHIINIKALKNKYIDYLALGHIHKYKLEKLDDRGQYCYPGCPEPRGFDELGEKGFVLLDIEGKKAVSEFISIQNRRFLEKSVELTPDMDMTAIYNEINKVIDSISPRDLLKLVLTGYTNMDRPIDVDRLRDRFMDKVYFLKLEARTRVKIDYDSFAYDRSLKGSFVRLVHGLDIEEDRKSKIIETGILAIMGENIEK